MKPFADSQIKDPLQERRIFRQRLNIVVVFIFILFFSVLGRVYYLQIWRYSALLGQSHDFHIRLRSISPERGLIRDRHGNVLAGNVLSYALSVHTLHVQDINQLLDRISRIVALDKEDIDKFLRQYRSSSFRNELIILKETLTEEEIAGIAVDKYHLLGVEVQPRYRRFYPHRHMVSHVLGHIGRLTEEEYADADQSEYQNFDHIGKLGLEGFYENKLRGKSGVEEVGVDAHGNVVKVYRRVPADRGKDISLWLDFDLQKFVWNAMEDKVGAVLVADVATGGILSMVSRPAYDNNQFALGLTQADFSKLLKQPDAPLLNRAASGRYPPGSTIKPFYAIYALENEIVTPEWTIHDKGYFKLPNSNQVFRNWKRKGHGDVALRRAIRVSSDTYFYNLAVLNGYEGVTRSLKSFRFGERGAADVFDEIQLSLPTPEWKIEHHNLPWFPGDTVNMGIGQGYLLASPLQLLTATLILANRGLDVRPYLAHFIGNATASPNADEYAIRLSAKQENWDLVFAGMTDVMHDKKEGTAKYAGLGMSYRMAGKTGTAQVVSLDTVERAEELGLKIKKEWLDHALFLAFAPAEAPKYAIVVVLENGGSGFNAAKLARKVMDYLMEDKKISSLEKE